MLLYKPIDIVPNKSTVPLQVPCFQSNGHALIMPIMIIVIILFEGLPKVLIFAECATFQNLVFLQRFFFSTILTKLRNSFHDFCIKEVVVFKVFNK
jgi:hypothetical protein